MASTQSGTDRDRGRGRGRGAGRGRGVQTHAISSQTPAFRGRGQNRPQGLGPAQLGVSRATPRSEPENQSVPEEAHVTENFASASYSTSSTLSRSQPLHSDTTGRNPETESILKNFDDLYVAQREQRDEVELAKPEHQEFGSSYGQLLSSYDGPLSRQGLPTPTRNSTIKSNAYKKKCSKFFEWGVVFKMIFYETRGISNRNQTDGKTIEPFVRESRYFMIVAPYATHCVCLPIHTYKRQGCTKPGMKESEVRQHAIIHDEAKEPESAKGEPVNIMLEAIPMCVKFGILDKMSRIRFDRLYTVTHNVEIQEVGRVDLTHQERISKYLYTSMQLGNGKEASSKDSIQSKGPGNFNTSF